jgi:hypothetical protein
MYMFFVSGCTRVPCARESFYTWYQAVAHGRSVAGRGSGSQQDSMPELQHI